MSTHLPKKTSPSHGGVRGADFNRRSSQFEGRFGRIFRSLPAATWSEDALRKLAGDGQSASSMSAEPERDKNNRQLPTAPREDVEIDGTDERPRTSRLHDDEENSGIDAGYTYLGQFIDHDITFDPASSLQKRNDVDALVDFRTPALDLDSLYGSGPDDQPYLYTGNGRKFQLGRDLLEGINGKPIGKDLPRHRWDDEDGTTYNRALIGDKRNDENVIVSQLHSIFLQFHNRLADDNPSWDFATIQRQVRWHYQYVVLHDFLLQITNSEVYRSVLPHIATGSSIHEHPPRLLFYKAKNEAFMPIEFAAAAYRFGHSMVRPIYRLNQRLTGGNNPPSDPTTPNEQQRGIDGRQFIFAGIPARGLNGFDAFPQEWGIDWNLFFDLTGDKDRRVTKDRTQPSYKIDTSLVNPLAFLPEFSAIDKRPPLDNISKLQPDPLPPLPKQFNNLAFRNLLRGMAMSLPSGQDVARAMGYTPLKDEELKVGKATTADEFKALQSIATISPDFIGKAPLWYYVLAEAAHDWLQAGGQPGTPVRMGKVGSRIVLETFVGLLMSDGHSLLRQAPAWTPEIGKKSGFDMPDLIKYALKH
jgi:Animal haem peroxidase